MREFTLYSSPAKAFPQTVIDASGKAFEINADFRTILKILDLYGDKDAMDALKFVKLLAWFYKGERPGGDEAFTLMFEFIAGHRRKSEEESAPKKPDYDFTFDADVIYSSFLKEYGVDLIEVPFLHWCKFKMMLAGLAGESPFKQRVEIRNMDLSGLKGERLAQVRKAKDAVRIPDRVYAEDEAEREKFIELWR